MKTPLVTVLLPAYNAAAFIGEAIDSVLAQTYHDFELLIIDDGSTDDTLTIIRSYTDERLRSISRTNRGLVATLNEGLQLARGQWIARFDADDICYPDRLQVQIDFLNAHPDHILVGAEADYMDEQGQHLFIQRFFNYDNDAIHASGFRQCPFIHSAVMYSRQAVLAAGGYNPAALTFEDHLLWRNLAPFGKMQNLHQPLIKVRFNRASATIDEKWRGKEFQEIKQRSIANGTVAPEDAIRLKEILHGQNFKKFKEAAYHSMIGKKYLWNQYQPAKARQHLCRAIRLTPAHMEPYLLYALSLLPGSMIKSIYNRFKKQPVV